MNEKNRRYGAIDGLRTVAAVGIVLMHVAANSSYSIDGFIYDRVIPSFTDFVFLFMTVSAFGMCCGYYDKVLNNKISLTDFYSRRYRKILPFFSVLVILDILVSPSAAAVYEGFADLTLMFGLMPNSISVIGVGWFLGLIFVFYMLFPFFCVLISSKKSAWLSFAVSLAYNFRSTHYFDLGRKNILFSGCFFIAGGLIFLYKDSIEKTKPAVWLSLAVAAVVFYYMSPGGTFRLIALSAALVCYAVTTHSYLLENRVTAFFSSISMEIYLSHMMIFRLAEKTGLVHRTANGPLGYIILSAVVITGATLFSVAVKYAINLISKKLSVKS